MNKEFIKACKQLELRQKATEAYGQIKELGTTFEENLLLYWFNTTDKTTKTIVYDCVKGVYVDF